MELNKQGILNTNINDYTYLVNNFSETNTTTNWTFGGTASLTNGIEILSGVNPSITSSTFTVNPDDIIVVEFTVSLPTPSTTTSNPGLYLGTKSGQSVYVHTFDHINNIWKRTTSTTTNPYFLHSYNSANIITMKNYILGYNVDLSNVPFGESTNTTYVARAIQLTGTDTTTNIRSGYNTNTSMVINFSNPKIYNLTKHGIIEHSSGSAEIGKGYVSAITLYEI